MSVDQLFNYDKKNGLLLWKNPPEPNRKRLFGKIAGTIDKDGYRIVMIEKKCFKVHRLIWFIEHGAWPKKIDHINGNCSDNRIENLRAVNHRQNMQNMKRHRNGRLVGAHFNKKEKIWKSHIVRNGKQIHLGNFRTEVEAHRRYMEELTRV